MKSLEMELWLVILILCKYTKDLKSTRTTLSKINRSLPLNLAPSLVTTTNGTILIVYSPVTLMKWIVHISAEDWHSRTIPGITDNLTMDSFKVLELTSTQLQAISAMEDGKTTVEPMDFTLRFKMSQFISHVTTMTREKSTTCHSFTLSQRRFSTTTSSTGWSQRLWLHSTTEDQSPWPTRPMDSSMAHVSKPTKVAEAQRTSTSTAASTASRKKLTRLATPPRNAMTTESWSAMLND